MRDRKLSPSRLTIPAGVWTQVNASWAELGNPATVGEINLIGATAAIQPTYWIDDLIVTGSIAPPPVVNTNKLVIAGPNALPNVDLTSRAVPSADSDVTLTYNATDITVANRSDLVLAARKTATGEYRVTFPSIGGTATVDKKVAGVMTTISTFAIPGTGARKVRFQIQGTNVRTRVWQATDPEPTTWSNQVVDTAVTGAGAVGFSVNRIAGVNTITIDDWSQNPWYLDDVTVTASASTLSTKGFESDVWVGATSTTTSQAHTGLNSLPVSSARSNVSFTASVLNTLSGWMKGTGTVTPTIQFFGPTFTLLGTATASNLILSSTAWQQWTTTYTPPAGTAFVQVNLDDTGNSWYLDDVIVTTGTGTATPTTVTVPVGWAPVTTSSTAGVTMSTFTHTVAAGDPVSWAFGLSQSVKAVGSISAYSGVDTTTPIDVTATGTNVSGTAHVAPSVTTTGVNRLGLTVTAATAVTSMTPPAGSTERSDQAGSAGAPTATIETSDFPQAAAGATGTKTTVTAAAATTTATLTLRPASSGGTTKVSYVRDVLNRIVERKVNDVTVARYTFSSGGDTPDAELDVTNVIQRRTLGLMGGAVLSKATGSSEIWSISNLHGDTIATLGSTGLVTGGPFTYDPFGKAIGGLPDNQIGSFDNGWLGQNQRPLEQQAGLRAVIEMGARIYDPQIGRFLQSDPIEGGTNNDCAYVEDPINQYDLNGKWCAFGKNPNGSCRGAKLARNPILQAALTIAACGGGPIACAIVNAGFIAVNAADRCKNGIDGNCIVGTAIDVAAAAFQVRSVKTAFKAAVYGPRFVPNGAILRPLIGPKQAAWATVRWNMWKTTKVVGGQFVVQKIVSWANKHVF